MYSSLLNHQRNLYPLLNYSALPIYTAQSRSEINQAGQYLFQHFIQEQLHNEGVENLIEESDSNANSIQETNGAVGGAPPLMQTLEAQHNYFTELGGSLRQYADAFASSRERILVRNRAQEIRVENINRQDFWILLTEMFRDGITIERVIALFFFCADVLVLSARSHLNLKFGKLFQWSLEFVIERVCDWVSANGGWERVFGNFWKVVSRATMLTLAFCSIGVCVVYIKKNW